MTTPTIPHNQEAERALLGSMLIDQDAIIDVEPIIREPGYFYIGKHQDIYREMLALHHGRKPIDLVTLCDKLEEHSNYLINLIDAVPSSVHAVHYAEIVVDCWNRRVDIRGSGKLATMAYDMDTPPEERQAYKEGLLLETAVPDEVRHIRQDMMDLWKVTEERIEAGGKMPGQPTGFVDLDRIMGGVRKQVLTLVAGRPGMGKSMFESILAAYIAKAGWRVLRVNMEMGYESLARRITSASSRVPYQNIDYGRFDNGQQEKFMQALGENSELPLWTWSAGAPTIEDLAAMARRHQVRHGLDLLTLDYIGLMGVTGGYGSMVHDIGIISRGLKQLSLELDINVLALSQLNRSCEQRLDKRPMLSDLRDSGTLEQDADQVIFLYRDGYYDPDTDQPKIVEANLAKNRNGATGMAELFFDGPTMLISNVAKSEAPF